MIYFTIIWIVCSVLSYGIAFAFFTKEYPSLTDKEDQEINRRFSISIAICGIYGLIGIFLISGFAKHGLKFK